VTTRAHDDLEALGRPRWRGQAGRLEVWYATFTDAVTGTGGWVHLEVVAPTDGSAAHAHGWTALFPAGGSAPVLARFGPAPVGSPDARDGDGAWCRVGSASATRQGADGGWAEVGPGPSPGTVKVVGAAGALEWELLLTDSGPPLFTFPRAVWERQLLPAAQIVPLPQARASGTVRTSGQTLAVDGPGGLARIYGHGNAQRWGWLHAHLDDGGVLEVVTATARRAVLRRVPPLALVQLRLPGERDWPANPVLAAPRFRTTLRADGFSVRGTAGGRRLQIEVDLDPTASVALRYVDPDGATATCTNSERATATVLLRDPGGRERRWRLDRTAHAEVGTRPAVAGSR
jgi:hypothetical protein